MQSSLDILLQVEPMEKANLKWHFKVKWCYHTLTRMEIVELEPQLLASCEFFQEAFPALLSGLAGGRAKVQEVAAMGENQERVYARCLK